MTVQRKIDTFRSKMENMIRNILSNQLRRSRIPSGGETSIFMMIRHCREDRCWRWSKTPCSWHLSPPTVKILAFGHDMINDNISQLKYWYFARNQFNGSLCRRWFRRHIDFTRISWTLRSNPWFTITCSIKNPTRRSRRNSASYRVSHKGLS
jgi:hypothetical protein